MWTLKARLLAGLAAGSLLLGVATAQWFPFLLATCLALSLVYARIALRPETSLVGQRTLSLDQSPEGEEVEITTRVENPGSETLFAEVRDRLPREVEIDAGRHATAAALEPGASTELSLRAIPHLLGVYEIGPLQARLEDPLGLALERQRPVEPSQLVVVPAGADLEDADPDVTEFQTFQGEYAVNRPGDGFDFYGLREYAEGDTFRSINWKASAKTGDLMVNQFERNTSSEVTILVDGRAVTGIGPEEATPFVLGARAVAGLLDAFLDRRDSPRVAIYGDGLRLVHPGPPDRVVNETLEALASWEPGGEEPLSHHLGDVLPRVSPGTPIVLVSPFVDDPTILESVTRMLAHDLQVLAVATPLPELPGTPEPERETLEADRRATLEGLRGFEIAVHRPGHLDRAPEVAP